MTQPNVPKLVERARASANGFRKFPAERSTADLLDEMADALCRTRLLDIPPVHTGAANPATTGTHHIESTAALEASPIEQMREALEAVPTKCALGVRAADEANVCCGYGNPKTDQCCKVRAALNQVTDSKGVEP